MKRIFFTIIFLTLINVVIQAQVPYFSGTVGDGRLYGYTSVKFRPGINAQETYTTFQYGLGNHFATGLDLYTSGGTGYTGFLIRGGYKFNKWFGIGAQATPSFDLSDNFKFSYLTGGLYLNGNIIASGKFFWCSNTWFNINRGAKNSYMNWEYIGVNIPLGKNKSISPMIGAIHSWEFNQDADLALGAYYTIKNWNFYIWGNDLCKKNPRLVIGVDFTLNAL